MTYVTNSFLTNAFNATLLIVFVSVIFIVGRLKTNYVSTIHTFSIGARDFSIKMIAFTLVATWVSASGFNIKLIKFYDNGWKYLLPSLGMIISILFITFVVIPKAHSVLGKTSVASYMGEYYGQTVRTLTAIISTIGVCGGIAIQFKISGNIAYYLWPIMPKEVLTLLFGALTVYYCYLGGVRSIIYTDIAQSILFTLAFVIAIASLHGLPKADIGTDALLKFNVMSVFNSSKEELITMGSLFFYFMIPAFSPTEFQRVSIGVNVKQVQWSWITSCIGFLLTILAGCYIAYQLFLINPNLPTEDRLSEFLNLLNPWLKIIIIIGILSMAMSTADSHINISAVMLANDTFGKNSWSPYKKLQMARKYTVLIGILAYAVTFWNQDLLKIIMFTSGFYMPLVTIPLMLAIFNYKISGRCVLISMIITAIFWIIWYLFISHEEPLIFTMTLNAFLLFITHYLMDKKDTKYFEIRSKLKGK